MKMQVFCLFKQARYLHLYFKLLIMRIKIPVILLVFGLQAGGFSQVVPDSAFNAKLRKFNGGWIAGDATFSIALPDGKTLWLFGDSFIGTVKSDMSIAAGAKMIRNCAVLQDGDSLTALYGGSFLNPESFVKAANEAAAWYWPEHGLVENDTLKIFFSEFVLAPGPSGFNFKYKAAHLARLAYPAISLIDLTDLPYYELNGVSYGNSVLVEDGYTYIYGRQETDTVYHIPYPHVARVPVGNILAPWEFYTGNGWSADPLATKRMSSAAVSQEFGVIRLKNKYVMISQEIWFSKKIYPYTSNTPVGPWTRGRLLYETPILFANTFTYNAFPHPQFNKDDQLLISYNSNGNFADIFTNVEVYRPRFIRVPFSMIDPTLSAVPLDQKKNDPEGLILFQSFPNPAGDRTRIRFEVVRRSPVCLQLFDMKGRMVQAVVDKILDPGLYDIDLDLSGLGSGAYRYQLGSKSYTLIKN
jgi:hypothetical protein